MIAAPIAASFTEVSGGVTALLGVAWALISGINSWREAPNRARLTGSQADREDQALWVERVESLRQDVKDLESRVDARDSENGRLRESLDMVRAQIDALRESKDAMEVDLRTRMREAEARAEASEARIQRLEAQLESNNLVPVT